MKTTSRVVHKESCKKHFPKREGLLYALFIACLLLIRPAIAEQVLNSEQTDGIYVQVSLDRTNALSSGYPLYYGFLCTNEKPRTIFYPKPEFLCRLQLFDSAGSNLPPTVVGSRLGDRFSDLKEYSRSSIGITARGIPTFGRAYRQRTAYSELPSIKKLFSITNDGRYELKCEFQVFERLGEGTNMTFKLIRIPPLRVPVVKADGQDQTENESPTKNESVW